MAYFHILIKLKSTDKKSVREPEKTWMNIPSNQENTLIDDIVIPYLNREEFFLQGTPLHKDEIDEFHIHTTENNTSEIVRTENDLRSNDFFPVSINDWVAAFNPDYSTEITNVFIKRAKAKSSVFQQITPIMDDLLLHLHDKIREVSYQKYKDHHYADAVESAFKEINDRLKRLYKKHKGTELDGNTLFSHIFNDDSDKTLLKVDDLSTSSGKDEQSGYRYLLMGAWSSQRNPKAHANLHITEDEAYDRLILASMLMKRIDKAVTYTFAE